MSTCLNCGHSDATGFTFCPHCGTRSAETTGQGDPLLGRTLNNKYRIEEKIGAGAMGTVYLGEHIGLKKKVALKILHPDLQVSDEALQRFQREGIAAGKFNHPHAIQIFDFDRGDGRLFYLAMEYVDGVNLTQFLAARGKLACDLGVSLARQLLSCLAEAHRHGIIHRDLKPDNIMVVEDARGELRLKVLDFGLSKLIHRRLGSSLMTQPGRLLGTPLYMAPEQIAGDEADARSDVYAAGLIVYEMLAGARPWQEADVSTVFMTRAQREAPSIAEDHPELDLPVELDQLLISALERAREARFATAEEMLVALEDVPVDDVTAQSRRASTALSAAKSRRGSTATGGRAATSGSTRSRSGATRAGRAVDEEPEQPSRSRALWWGAGAFLLLCAAGALVLKSWSGERPPRVRMIAADDRTEVEARYVAFLDEARGAVRSRDLVRAMGAVDQALLLPCRDAEGLCVRAEVFAAKGDVDTALAEYRAAAGSDATYLEPQVGAGWLAFDRGEIDAAERSFTDAGAIDAHAAGVLAGHAAVAWHRGNTPSATELFDRALAMDPSSARANRYAGRMRFEAGDVDGAIARLVEAKRNDPRSAEVFAWLGEAYLARERFDDANAQLEESLALEPNQPRVRELRACMLLQRGRTSEALEFLKLSVERHSDRGMLWVLRGVALQESGDNAAALECVKRGIELGERSPQTRSLLGVLYQRQGQLDLAMVEFDAVIAEDGDVPLANLDVGLALFAKQKYAEAAQRFERVLALADDDAAAHFHLGLLYMDHLGDAAKAREHLRRYVELGGADARVQGWLQKLP